MSDIVLSKNQKLAIETKDKNILISAAAGAGKTFVLVQRILKMITQDAIDIDSLLIVTFSNPAAAEMRERIGKAIKEALDKKPYDKNLQRQALLLNKANISTIDAFCGNVVKNNFYKTEIDPGYRIISDEDEINKLRLEAIDKLFNDKYETEDEDFLKLVNTYCNEYKDDKLVAIMLSIYNEACNNPYPVKWLEMCRKNYDINKYGSLYNTPFGKGVAEKITEYYNIVKDILSEMSRFVEFENNRNSFSIEEDFCNILSENSIDNITPDMFLKSSKSDYENIPDELLYLHYDALDFTQKAKKLICDRRIAEEILAKQKPYVDTLINIIIEFSEIYKNIKLEKKAAEFNDIQHYALEILRDSNGNPTEVADALKEKYYEIIIDEYQDSNNLQEAIFTAFSRGNNMFMVGDIKQSIYRFRQANPELFKYKYDTFPKSDNSVLIQLSENYRSKKCVIDFCNHIFRQLMTESFGEVDYTEEVELKHTDKQSEIYYNTQIHILERAKDLPEDLIGLTNVQYEAEYIAEQIKHLLEENPDIKPSDIAILSREKKSVFYVMLNALAKRGIPASAENISSFSATLEIQTIISLLKLIDNPYDNIPVITILHSQIYNFSDEELLNIRLCDDSSMFYSCILEYVKNNNDSVSDRLNVFLNHITDFRNFALNNSLSRLISYIYDKTGYYTFISILPNGRQRQANLTLLTELAENFEKYNSNNLSEFIDYIETSQGINEAVTGEDNSPAVKIVTMHKSKGLEYPVVFIGFTGSNLKKPKHYPIIHHKYGFALKYIKDDHYVLDTPMGDLFKNLLADEELSESLRLLYVALTRAKERLIITGVAAQKDYEYYQEMNCINPKYDSINKTNYLNWILCCLSAKEFSGADIIFIPWNNDIAGYKNYEKTSEEMLYKIKSIDFNSDYNGKLQQVTKELDYVYHNVKAQQLPTKASISEIKRMFTHGDVESDVIFNDIIFEYPDFITEDITNFNGAMRGTIYHMVFEHLDFLKVKNRDDIVNSIDDMVKNNILKQEEARIINPDKIMAFVNSALYERMQNAKGIYKETQFIMSMSGEEIYGSDYADTNNDIIVRGIIDLYFIEDDHIVLVDYKTDAVKNHNLQQLKDKYHIQLELYKKALEMNTGMKVTECIIYSVSEGCSLVL